MKHIGLFEGIGGFSLAARWMGWETKAWCEINPFCQQVLKHHFPEAEVFGDITTTDFKKYATTIDVLTGGFPCQPYSIAGKRKGKEDERHLWPEMLRAVREISPRWVVGENVRGLTNWNGGLVFDEVQSDLEAEGYEVLPFLLPACAVNAPHRRDRIWFIAYSNAARGMRTAGEDAGKSKEEWLQKRYKVEQLNKPSSLREFPANPAEQGLEGGERRTPKRERLTKHSELYSTWSKFPTQPPLRSRDDGISNELSGITFSKHRNESIKAYGNAIVPQVAYEIFKAIEQFEKII